MNKNERRKLRESVRAEVLRHNAAHYTHGVYMYARVAAAKRKIPDLLHGLAHAVANNEPLTINERMFLSALLAALSYGDDVRKKLRLHAPKVGHRPSQAILNAEIVRELKQRIADGQPPGAAFEDVAAIAGKLSAEAIRKIWERAQDKRSANVRCTQLR